MAYLVPPTVLKDGGVDRPQNLRQAADVAPPETSVAIPPPAGKPITKMATAL
jgi:hypothetical protein